MRRIFQIGLILGLVFPAFGFANSGGGGGNDSKDSEDSTAVANELTPGPDDFLSSPGFDVFEINPEAYKVARWDTHSLNIYGVDMNRFRDTLTYILDEPGLGHEYHVPVNGRITSGFGRRRGGFHYGIDIDLETGDPVVAVMGGVVRIANYNRGYGNMVVIAHEGGLETLYGHMSKLDVKEGEMVEAGQQIGLGGTTGRSTGPHLHLEFFIFGEQVNPLNILDPVTLRPVSSAIKVDASWFDYMLDLKNIKYYEVEEGETLDDIALMFEKDSQYLADLNGIPVDAVLEPGRKILLE